MSLRYDKLCKEAQSAGAEIIEKRLRGNNRGLYGDGVILIDKRISSTIKKTCILVEELGHFHTSSGNILNQSVLSNRKQERRARGWGYEQLVPLDAIVEAYLAGVIGRHEIAEFIEVTEEFLNSAVVWYQEKYGLFTTIDEYIIYFDPLAVAVMFE